MGQHENGGDLEHQGAQERNNGGYYAVVERGKECRAKDVKTAEQEAEGIQLHAEGSQFQQFRIITHKEAGPAFTGDEDEAARLAALWCSMSVPVDEEKIREAADVITVQCRDPLDQKFFTLTLAGGAKLLVSKDKLVLKAGRKMKRYGACAFRPEETAARLDALS